MGLLLISLSLCCEVSNELPTSIFGTLGYGLKCITGRTFKCYFAKAVVLPGVINADCLGQICATV